MVRWRDGYSGAKLTCHVRWMGRGFTNGGTLNAFVRAIAKWIHSGKGGLGVYAFWQPSWYSGGKGNCWGYDEASMEKVRDKAIEIGVLQMGPKEVMAVQAMLYGWTDADLVAVEEHGDPVG